MVPAPCNYVVRAVVLLEEVQNTVPFVDDGPVFVEVLIYVSHWMQEVSRVRQAVSSERPKLGELPPRAPDFSDISTAML